MFAVSSVVVFLLLFYRRRTASASLHLSVVVFIDRILVCPSPSTRAVVAVSYRWVVFFGIILTRAVRRRPPSRRTVAPCLSRAPCDLFHRRWRRRLGRCDVFHACQLQELGRNLRDVDALHALEAHFKTNEKTDEKVWFGNIFKYFF